MYVFLSLSNNIPVLLISYRRTTIWNFLNIGPQNLSFKTSSHLRKTMFGKSWSLVKMGRHLLWRRGESKEYLQKTWSSMTSHLIFRYSCISSIPFHSLWELTSHLIFRYSCISSIPFHSQWEMTSHLIFRYSCISFIPFHSLWEI